jgi:hypothetical protein
MIEKRNKIVSHFWPISIIGGLIISVLISALMMFIAWDHNPQGEIHNELGIQWKYWLSIGGSWFISIFTITLIGSIVLISIIKWLRNRPGKRDESL